MTTISKSAYEGDLVSRLRNWRGLHLAHGGELYEQAADEIARLRGDAEVARLRLEASHAENERLRLTDAERSAIRDAADRYATCVPESAATAEALRGLLDRTGHQW